MAEVERRAKEIRKELNLTPGSWDPSMGIAYMELTKEIEEGKV